MQVVPKLQLFASYGPCVMSIGSDGASIMTGRVEGVNMILKKEKRPLWLIYIAWHIACSALIKQPEMLKQWRSISYTMHDLVNSSREGMGPTTLSQDIAGRNTDTHGVTWHPWRHRRITRHHTVSWSITWRHTTSQGFKLHRNTSHHITLHHTTSQDFQRHH